MLGRLITVLRQQDTGRGAWPWICAASVGFFFLFAAEPARPADLAIRLVTQEWQPYQSRASGRPTGVAVEMVRCVLGRLGRQAEIVFLPWQRAQADVRKGRADGFFAASQSPERDAYATLSAPIAPQQWTWYYAEGAELVPGDAAFKNTARVTATSGSNMAGWLHQSGYNVQDEPRGTDQLVKMLERGHVDAVLANPLAFEAALESTGVPVDRFLRHVEREQPLGVYFGKDFLARNPDFLSAFNGEIAGCMGDR